LSDEVVFRSGSRHRCHELWVVLDAAGIPARVVDRGRSCLLVVREDDRVRAALELDDYRSEGLQIQPEPELTVLPGGWLGILLYAAALVAVSGLADRGVSGLDWFDVGRGQAGLMRQGEWWRALTALTLHVDARHLMGNLFFGSVLGFLAAQRLGGGAAWLAIVVGGALGNVANAVLRDPGHSGVGASTAVFACLGLLVALGLHYKRGRSGSVIQRLSPLFAGIMLLAWTGIGGERTDVLAHVTGLVSGLLVGAGCGWIPLAVLERRWVQIVASGLALLLPALAWSLALR